MNPTQSFEIGTGRASQRVQVRASLTSGTEKGVKRMSVSMVRCTAFFHVQCGVLRRSSVDISPPVAYIPEKRKSLVFKKRASSLGCGAFTPALIFCAGCSGFRALVDFLTLHLGVATRHVQ